MDAYCIPRFVMGNMIGTVDTPFEVATTDTGLVGADAVSGLGIALVEIGGELTIAVFIGKEARRSNSESESPFAPKLASLLNPVDVGKRTSLGEDEDISTDAALSAGCRGARGTVEPN